MKQVASAIAALTKQEVHAHAYIHTSSHQDMISSHNIISQYHTSKHMTSSHHTSSRKIKCIKYSMISDEFIFHLQYLWVTIYLLPSIFLYLTGHRLHGIWIHGRMRLYTYDGTYVSVQLSASQLFSILRCIFPLVSSDGN